MHEVSRRSGRRLHESLVEVMAAAVIGTDVDYRVTLWNPAAERLYGYSAEEAMGRPAREIATYENDTSRARLEAAPPRGAARGRSRPRWERARRVPGPDEVRCLAGCRADRDGRSGRGRRPRRLP